MALALVLSSDVASFYPCVLVFARIISTYSLQSASQPRPDLEPAPLPKLGLIHKLYFVTLLVCKSTTLVANGSSNVCRVARSLVRRPVGAVRGTRTASLWISEGQNTLRVEEASQIYPERALCACVSISRGGLLRRKLPRGTGSIVDLLGPGCGASVASGLRRPRLGLTVPLRAMYFQSYRVCN